MLLTPIRSQLENRFEENNLLQDFQFGFRRNKSTVSELLTLFDKLLKGKEEGHEISLLVFDLSAAFDTIDHSLLLAKLEIYGCDKHSLAWFKSYLQDRIQKVTVNGELSESLKINRGTPQGSRLSPLLFIILMADLNLHIKDDKKCQLSNFADDTQLATIEETEEKAIEKTQEEASAIIPFLEGVKLCIA